MNPMLALKYDPTKHDIRGWLCSEKLDGVRAIWDGARFVSRNGKEFDAPYRVRSRMPDVVLDGELYMGRGRFNETSGTVRRHGDEWFGIEYHVFDMPLVVGPFKLRFTETRKLVQGVGFSFMRLVEHYPVESHDHLMDEHAKIVMLGGEGVMVRDPLRGYEERRSPYLLKVKGWHEAEARCIGIVVGKGKYIGMIGALNLQDAEGRRFQCGSGLNDDQRSWATECFVGKQITYKYFELTPNGVPRFPIFKTVRDYE